MAAAPDPVDHTRAAAPDGTPMCAAWVHDRHTVTRGGRTWPTWHPPIDPVYHCAFGHEHGSNPRALPDVPAHGHAGAGSDRRLRGQRRAARRLQGLRGERRPQGPVVDDRAPPGLGLAPPGHGALPLARDLALPGPPAAGPHPRDGRLRSRGGQLPRRGAEGADAAPARPRLPLGLRGVVHGGQRGRGVPRLARVRDRQRHNPVRSRRPRADRVQQALRLRPARPGRLALLLQGRQAHRAAPEVGGAQPRGELALPDRRPRPPGGRGAASGGGSPRPGEPARRVLRRGERLRDGAALRRRHLPGGPRVWTRRTSSSRPTASCAPTSRAGRAGRPSL